MAVFIELQLDPVVSYGTKGGLVYPAIVVGSPSRSETRFSQTSRGYWNSTIAFTDKKKSQMRALSQHWGRAKGKVNGWRWRNYDEYYSCTDDQVSETITKEPVMLYTSGVTMQLTHTRWPGTSEAEIVLIRKPCLDIVTGTTTPKFGVTTFALYRDGSGTPWSNTNYTLDVTTGIVTFNVDQAGHTFEHITIWDTPSRFDFDGQEKEVADFDDVKWADVRIMEVRV